jgi:hypothetical protein
LARNTRPSANQARLAIDELHHLALVPDMIARSENVDPALQELSGNFARDTGTPGGVLTVRNHQINVVRLHDRAEAAAHQLTSRPCDDVADKEQLHC